VHPETTKYTLATKKDEVKCLALARNHGMETVARLDFPTVVAKRKGKILGFLSTRPTKDAIVAGPIVVAPEVKGPITMRLVEAYEEVLRRAGVLSYLFRVSDPHWKEQVERVFDLKPYHVDGEHFWFERRIDGRRRRTNGSGAIGG
jgi:hypothetical protein